MLASLIIINKLSLMLQVHIRTVKSFKSTVKDPVVNPVEDSYSRMKQLLTRVFQV